MAYPRTVIKAHGTGNDFVIYVDETGEFEPTTEEIRFLDDRHFGIGGDGVIRLTRPEFVSDISEKQARDFHEAGAHWFMDYRNADGSLAQMCGNGTRVTAALAMREGITEATEEEPFALATRAGIKYLTYLGEVEGLGTNVFRIDMGPWKIGTIDEYMVTIPRGGEQAMGTFVDMGNPHVVTVLSEPFDLKNMASMPVGMPITLNVNTMPDVEQLDLSETPRVSPELPEGQNAEFVRIDSVDRSHDMGVATMRVNERGAGETLSCGTGLCATGVVLTQRTNVKNWTISVPGGTLVVNVENDRVLLTGDAKLVAEVEVL
ncbi:diaminopimelate epimerase [Alloscardovia theropitheci]|uniref:Diaminopimelate epimerase n=1 Tax=Alloscardovia theropitheci TaxID=2496842 RepID=A0A4R0R0V1_9BIFI|nr:diaminopimelate epimerase [Alloscardovia theropitheci]TCD54716.1 diaminopimelate epimerase [Alloscardovia theropitheci]